MLDLIDYDKAVLRIEAGADRSGFLQSVHEGLSRPQKTLECKYLYDERGSELFDEICNLPEYYPTRTEIAILQDNAGAIAECLGSGVALIELGSGASIKTRILLSALKRVCQYIPVDISEEFLLKSAHALREDFPDIDVQPVVADFMQPFDLPAVKGRSRALFFPGSTIGNLHREDAADFLMAIRLATKADQLLIGVDLKKDRQVLEAAYDDAAGVTAEFNLNLLRRINRELEATFDLEKFRHKALYNETKGRVEMHLESLVKQKVEVQGCSFQFEIGETIHSENSYKYDVSEFAVLAETAGWYQNYVWRDSHSKFAVFLFDAA